MASYAVHNITAASPRGVKHLLPSVARPGESSYASPKRQARSIVSEKSACIALAALVVCLLTVGVIHEHGSERSQDNNAIGLRSWRDVGQRRVETLEYQLQKKTEEVAALELALRQQVASRARSLSNMHAQEVLITTLQQRMEAEKAEKQRAMYSLGIMSQQVDGCVRTTERQEEALAECRHKLGHSA